MPPHDHQLTLLTRPGCTHCDAAREVLRDLARELVVPWEERDVTADPRELDEYGDRVPVVLLDGREHGYWTVDVPRLRRDLAR